LVHVVPVDSFVISQQLYEILQNLDDGFFPDKDDCRKFHVCYGGTQSIRWCKDGMIWDETKIGCSMQNNTLCTGGRKKWGRNEGNSNLCNSI